MQNSTHGINFELIAHLENLGQLRVLADDEVESARISQNQGLATLMERATTANSRSDRTREFLCLYDAMMRHLEIALLDLTSFGIKEARPYQLSISPHATLRALAPCMWEISLEQLSRLISARHKAKKENISPSEAELIALRALLSSIK